MTAIAFVVLVVLALLTPLGLAACVDQVTLRRHRKLMTDVAHRHEVRARYERIARLEDRLFYTALRRDLSGGYTPQELELGVNSTDQLIATIDKELEPYVLERERVERRERREREHEEFVGRMRVATKAERQRMYLAADHCPVCDTAVTYLDAHLTASPDCRKALPTG